MPYPVMTVPSSDMSVATCSIHPLGIWLFNTVLRSSIPHRVIQTKA